MNLFEIETPRKKVLAFITQGVHLSGDIMKAINFRNPRVIEKLKKNKENYKTGDVIEIDNYIFVVYKKHFNSRIDEKDFENLLKNISFISPDELKTTNEHLSEFEDLIKYRLDGIEFRETVRWRSDW